MLVLLAVAAAAMVTTSCATTRAAAPVEQRPALEVPPPPPRVITPMPPPETQPLEPVADIPSGTANPPARPRPQRDRSNDAAKPADPKPETLPVEQPPPPQPPPPVQPQLRIPETTNAAQTAAQIRDTINRTRAILASIDHGPLSDARKKAYTDAQLFANQADDALKASNLVFAKELAEKAERLAKEIQGR